MFHLDLLSSKCIRLPVSLPWLPHSLRFPKCWWCPPLQVEELPRSRTPKVRPPSVLTSVSLSFFFRIVLDALSSLPAMENLVELFCEVDSLPSAVVDGQHNLMAYLLNREGFSSRESEVPLRSFIYLLVLHGLTCLFRSYNCGMTTNI